MTFDPFPTPHPGDTGAPGSKAESDALFWADGLAAIEGDIRRTFARMDSALGGAAAILRDIKENHL